MIKGKNNNFHIAKRSKNDEFYTQLPDIEKELKNYKKHFKNKTVYLNCDDPRESNFFKYFSYNFEKLGLKKLIATCYKSQDINLFSRGNSEKAIKLEYMGDKNGNRIPDADEIGVEYLKGDGDFRSEECIKILKQADIIVTNPPFSLFRQYIPTLIKYNKKFLIVGNQAAIAYKDMFKLIKEGKLWLGNNNTMEFRQPNKPEIVKFGLACWFTNLETQKRNEEIILTEKYNKKLYPKYDDYNAISIDKVKLIPINYKKNMGVPITFMHKFNPNQFEIVDLLNSPVLNGKHKYARIIIRNKRI